MTEPTKRPIGRPKGSVKEYPPKTRCRDCETEYDTTEFNRRGNSGPVIDVCRPCAADRMVKVNARKKTKGELEYEINRLRQVLQLKLEVLAEKEREENP